MPLLQRDKARPRANYALFILRLVIRDPRQSMLHVERIGDCGAGQGRYADCLEDKEMRLSYSPGNAALGVDTREAPANR